MKKIFFTLLIISSSINSYSQKKGQSEIVVNLNDTTQIFEKIKYALDKRDYKIHDDYSNNRDTIITNARAIYYPTGHVVIKAVIKDKTVVFSGWFKQLNTGSLVSANEEKFNLKTFRTITYFGGSSSWRQLYYVAEELKKVKLNDVLKNSEVESNSPKKSKEIRLRELKDLFEKELITKEDYDRAKQKILDEN